MSEDGTDSVSEPTKEKGPPASHVKTPSAVKGIYMSQCVVGTPSFRDELVALAEETEINSIVIDIKDFTGTIGFPTDHPLLKDAAMQECGAADMRDFIARLHEKGIYVIGRITVFQDPFYTKKHPEQAVRSATTGGPWKDRKGLSFIDVSSEPYWDVVVALSEESYALGFDELNYDYVRYPSDGNMDDARYVDPNKTVALERFFTHLREKVAPTGVVMSADLFGMTTTNTDDLGIGQVLERALPHFDYIMPMVYPSHYPKGFKNLGNPNDHPYEIIKFSMDDAVRRTVATTTLAPWSGGAPVASTSPQLYTKPAYEKTKLRTWIQDFDYGGDYDAADVRAQIQATYDAGLTSWVLWAPSNRYTRAALEAE